MNTATEQKDPAAIVDALERDGVVKLNAFLPSDTLHAVKRELDAARARLGDTGSPPSQRGPSLYPTSMLVRGRLGEISNISRILNSRTLETVRRRKIGRDAYVSDIVGIDSVPEHRTITQWHVDGTLDCIAAPGTARIKLFFYLNDVSSRNGAFSYVAGSHLILDHLHRGMHAGEMDPVAIRDLSELRTFFETSRPSMPDNLKEMTDRMFSTIASDTAPCGPYSLEGPAGTLVIFDERGMHRGGDISEGNRSILRISLRSEKIDSFSDMLRAFVRKTARLVLPRHFAKLM